ncbi:MAG: hypothetical protein JNM17_31550 [Archangium sp.]|nr:hypothetical protein [Archangium sp.]
MRTCLAAAVSISILFSFGCGTPTPTPMLSVTVADHSDALSDKNNDNLFVLTFATVPTPIAAADLQVTGAVAGGSNFQLNFTHADANGDGNIDSGDTVTCREPGTGGAGGLANIFDVPNVGQTITVNVARLTGPSMATQLARLQWVPTN